LHVFNPKRLFYSESVQIALSSSAGVWAKSLISSSGAQIEGRKRTIRRNSSAARSAARIAIRPRVFEDYAHEALKDVNWLRIQSGESAQRKILADSPQLATLFLMLAVINRTQVNVASYQGDPYAEQRQRQRMEEHEAEALAIVSEEAKCCGGWAGGLFFLPGSGKISQAVVQRRMLKKILAVFGVRGDTSHLVNEMIDCCRDGAETAALMIMDGLKVVPIVGWFFGGGGCGVGACEQTERLGRSAVRLLKDVCLEHPFPDVGDVLRKLHQ
jgi:uncharacterized protein (DUF697 family)